MQAPSRIKTLIISAALGLAIGSVIWWASAPDPQTAETRAPESIRSSAAVAPEPRSSESPSSPAESSPPPETPAVLSPDESRWIEARLGEARAVLRGIEASHVIPLKKTETDDLRRESVRIPPLTVEQLQPVYNALSRASNDLASGSHVAREFRRRVDAFLGRLQRRPAKFVRRQVDKHTKVASFTMLELSEKTVVTEEDDGVIKTEGGPMLAKLPSTQSEDFEHLFDKDPSDDR
jgi:hypothetical protein